MKAQTLRHEKEAVHGGSHLLSQHWKAEVVELLQVQSHPELQCETFLISILEKKSVVVTFSCISAFGR